MELECHKEKIQNAINYAEKVTGKNLSLDALAFVLLVAEKNSLKVRATNLNIGVEVTVPAKVKKEGTVLIPGNILSSLFSNIHSETVALMSDKNNNLTVTSSHTSTNIKTRPYEDFPILPKITSEDEFTLSVEDFLLGLSSVFYSSATSDIKPEISSIFIYKEGDYIYYVATDSFRLAEKKVKIKANFDKEFSLLIPYKNVQEIIRIFDGKKGDVKISFNENQITFALDEIYITSRLINGVFPDYKQLIPKEFQTEVIILKDDFLSALKISNIFSDKFNKITFSIKPKDKEFFLNTHNTDLGENKVSITASVSGEDVVVSFNHRYIHEALSSLKRDSVVLNLNSEAQPMVMKGVNDDSFTYLIMPLNS